MEKFCINVLGAKVRYVSDVPLKEYFDKNKDFMEFYNANFIEDSDEIKYTIEYHDEKEKGNPIQVDEHKIIVKYPFEELTESIILYLGFHFLERQFGEMKMCSCHSACVEKNGKAILIIGEAGAGKTSLAVNLCNRGYSLISNDMTLIGEENGNLYAYGGTKFINLRYLSVLQNMPFLDYLFKDKNKDSWLSKISVMARDIGIDENYSSVLIDSIIFLRMNNNEELTVSSGDTWRNNFLLYQNTSSHIRGTAATFIDKKGHPIGYIPSMETEETYKNRMEILKLINENSKYFYVSGCLNDIMLLIDSLSIREIQKTLKGE